MLEQGLCPLYPGSSHPSSSKPFTSILFIPELLVPLTLPPVKAASGLSPPALGAHLPWLAPSLRAALSSLLSSPGPAPHPSLPVPRWGILGAAGTCIRHRAQLFTARGSLQSHDSRHRPHPLTHPWTASLMPGQPLLIHTGLRDELGV